jgi:hypothetical protein
MAIAEVEIIAHKGSSTKFTVPNGTNSEIENAIAEKLRSELVWEDDPGGIKVDVRLGNKTLKPRWRFSATKDVESE